MSLSEVRIKFQKDLIEFQKVCTGTDDDFTYYANLLDSYINSLREYGVNSWYIDNYPHGKFVREMRDTVTYDVIRKYMLEGWIRYQINHVLEGCMYTRYL